MAGLTDTEAFTARELHERGVWSGRIAELLDIEEADVRRALAGHRPEPQQAPEPVQPKLKAPKRAAQSWPPLPDASTVWEEMRVYTTYPDSEVIRVRPVRLWGREVRINMADEVWCPNCRKFKDVAYLGGPYNSCPVGIMRTGIHESDASVPLDGEPGWDGAAQVDLLRTPL
jgi:hypothetical protein